MADAVPQHSQGTCPECGATLPPGGSCLELFHRLLALEWEIPGGPGEMAHFFAVSTYVLQHPDGMRYRAEALLDLREAVTQALAGSLDIEGLRRWARHEAPGSTRITRRGDEPVLRWPVARWKMTVTDALEGGTDGYADRVELWASASVAAIDASIDDAFRKEFG